MNPFAFKLIGDKGTKSVLILRNIKFIVKTYFIFGQSLIVGLCTNIYALFDLDLNFGFMILNYINILFN